MKYEFKQDLSEEIFFRKYALHGETTVEDVLIVAGLNVKII